MCVYCLPAFDIRLRYSNCNHCRKAGHISITNVNNVYIVISVYYKG